MKRPRVAASFALLLVVLFQGPATARAGTLRLDVEVPDPRLGVRQHVLIYSGASGERNRVRIDVGRTGAVVTDAAGVVPTKGCWGVGPRRARCRFQSRIESTRVVATLGDRDDSAVVAGRGGTSPYSPGPAARLRGGSGSDRLRLLSGTGYFKGGPGRDRLVGGPLYDTFDEGRSASGPDLIVGGLGRDEVSFAGRRAPVEADLEGDRDDGERREADRIGADIEVLTGGRAADVLTGGPRGDCLSGGLGADVMNGAGGNDVVAAGECGYLAIGPPEAEVLSGGVGEDELIGSAGPDRIDPGPGRDSVLAEGGNDAVSARDEATDVVYCSFDSDLVELDRLDYYAAADRIYADSGCEQPIRDSAAPGAVLMPVELLVGGNVWGKARVESGVAVLPIGCAADAPDPCTGSAELVQPGGRRIGSRSFSLIPGAEYPNDVVRLRLGRRDRAQARSRVGLPAILTIRSPNLVGLMEERSERILLHAGI